MFGMTNTDDIKTLYRLPYGGQMIQCVIQQTVMLGLTLSSNLGYTNIQQEHCSGVVEEHIAFP